jgi:hypothetical protein
MPDPTPHDGFTFHVNEAEKAVKESLPAVAQLLSSSASELVTRDWMGGTGYVEDAGRTQDVYYMYLDMLGRRQFRVGGIVHDTADTLQEIINLYRRADGQG